MGRAPEIRLLRAGGKKLLRPAVVYWWS